MEVIDPCVRVSNPFSPCIAMHWLIRPILQRENIYLIDIYNCHYKRLCIKIQVTSIEYSQVPGREPGTGWEHSRFVQDGSGHQHLHYLQLRVYQTDRIFPFVWSKSFSNGLAFMSYCASLDVTFYLLTGEKWFITLSWSHILMPYRIHALRKIFLFMARKDGQCGLKNYVTEL